jgi:hypothetical protein
MEAEAVMPLAFVQGEEMRDDHYVPLSDKGRVITIADWAKCAAWGATS